MNELAMMNLGLLQIPGREEKEKRGVLTHSATKEDRREIILKALSEDDMTSADINIEYLLDVPASTVRRDIQALMRESLVSAYRVGQVTYYRIASDA